MLTRRRDFARDREGPMEQRLNANELKALLAGGAAITLVDVRRASARAADPRAIAGAVWRDRDQVATWARELPKGRPVVAYCGHGRTGSAGVVDRLRELGFEAALLEGGFEGWKAAGGELTPGDEAVSTGAAGRPSHSDAEVTEASEDSFPASDPPSYTPVSRAGRPERD
jgi:rhodanese-related sulfurtransferase